MLFARSCLFVVLLTFAIADPPVDQHIMMSYRWADSSDLVAKMYPLLVSAGYKVWLDKYDMRGDMYQHMADAVDESFVFLMFVSPGYKTSANCKRESQYAADKQKTTIPIHVVDGYRADGWLALLEAGMLYYDFSDESVFEDKMKELLIAIEEKSDELEANLQGATFDIMLPANKTQLSESFFYCWDNNYFCAEGDCEANTDGGYTCNCGLHDATMNCTDVIAFRDE